MSCCILWQFIGVKCSVLGLCRSWSNVVSLISSCVLPCSNLDTDKLSGMQEVVWLLKCLSLMFVFHNTALSTCALGFEKQPSAILESLALLLTVKLWRQPHNWSISEPGNEIMIEHPAVTGYVTTVTASNSTTHPASTCCRQFANRAKTLPYICLMLKNAWLLYGPAWIEGRNRADTCKYQ